MKGERSFGKDVDVPCGIKCLDLARQHIRLSRIDTFIIVLEVGRSLW